MTSQAPPRKRPVRPKLVPDSPRARAVAVLLQNAPPSQAPTFKRAFSGQSMAAGVKAKCLECCCFDRAEVRDCLVLSCPSVGVPTVSTCPGRGVMLATACPKPPPRLPAEKRRPRKFGTKHDARTLATRLCSVLTLARAWGRCEFCWAKATEAAHGLGKKSFPAIRYDARNIFAACHRCHERNGPERAWWDAQRRRILGDADFDAVYAARLGKGPQLEDVIAAATVGRFLVERS